MYDSAFKAALYEQLSHVYRYLIKKGANPQDAEDIVQDTAYKYLMNLEAIEAAKALEGTLVLIMRIQSNGI